MAVALTHPRQEAFSLRVGGSRQAPVEPEGRELGLAFCGGTGQYPSLSKATQKRQGVLNRSAFERPAVAWLRGGATR